MSESRRRGRPALEESAALRSRVCVRFTIPIHDELLKLARLKRTTLPDFVRDCVFSALRKSKSAESPLR